MYIHVLSLPPPSSLLCFISVSENCPEGPILQFALFFNMTSVSYIFIRNYVFAFQYAQGVIQKLLLQSCILFNLLDSLQESNEITVNGFQACLYYQSGHSVFHPRGLVPSSFVLGLCQFVTVDSFLVNQKASFRRKSKSNYKYCQLPTKKYGQCKSQFNTSHLISQTISLQTV